MNTTYFLTGFYQDQDKDFELTIAIPEKSSGKSPQQYVLELTDLAAADKLLWQTEQTTFLLGLDALDEFLIENTITLYSKILTTEFRDKSVDKELEGFILNRLEY